jgi:hypothetical protein
MKKDNSVPGAQSQAPSEVSEKQTSEEDGIEDKEHECGTGPRVKTHDGWLWLVSNAQKCW